MILPASTEEKVKSGIESVVGIGTALTSAMVWVVVPVIVVELVSSIDSSF